MDALILSAGKASRFGAPKFLLPAGLGHTLLSRAVERALASVDGKVGVVVGRQAEPARCAVEQYLAQLDPTDRPRVEVIHNADYAQGLSTSLKAGLHQLASREGVMVLLADHPTPTLEQLRSLVTAFHRRPLGVLALATAEQGEQRPPVLLSPVLFGEIMTLSGEQGARAVLQRLAHRVQLVEWGSGPWYHDIDTWEDYRQVYQQQGWREESLLSPRAAGPLEDALNPLLEAALQQPQVTWLAPGILVMPSWGEVRCLPLRPAVGPVQCLITGQADMPAQYLHLLRQAALWALAQTMASPTRL
jgi:molybdenum cofactor cytidylyltransferase